MVNKLSPGKIQHRIVDGMSQMEYFFYIPESYAGDGKVFFSIHGISRNAEEHVQGFTAQAERYGTIVIAPLFLRENFPRYQQLGTSVQQERADMAFDHVLQDAHEWLSVPLSPMHIFGFSGGGQFVHRYALFYPKRVARMVLAASGWYTFPDPDRKYPYGLKSTRDWPRLSFNLEKFLSIPILILSGEEDDLRERDLNRVREIDCFQGLNRVERAQRWINSIKNMARAYDISSDFQLEMVPNASHAYESFVGHPYFAERVFDFLFGEHS